MRTVAASRRFLAGTLRFLLLSTLAVALAGPHTVRVTDRFAVVAVVDVSASVRTFAGDAATRGRILDAVRDWLSRATGRRDDDDLVGLVLFDGASVVVSRPSRADASGRDWERRMVDGTDIAGALRLARSIIPPDCAGRLLLVSDGNQTAGDALAAASEAGSGASRVPVDVMPLSYALDREVAVEQVDVPGAVQASAPLPVRIVLSAAGEARGFLRLFMDDRPVDLAPGDPGDARAVSLSPGMNVERVDVQLDGRRVHRFRAVFEPETEANAAGEAVPVGDTVLDNNVAEGFTVAPGDGSVLVLDGVGDGDPSGRGSLLASTLRRAGLEVTLLPAASAPSDLLAFQDHDAVILQNVPADALSPDAQRAMATFVQDMGGGLVMVGGPASFGAGGWKGTPIEPILPVRLDLPEKLVTSQVAIVFVLDNSGSMWRYVLGSPRTQQEIANDAAAIAIRTLERSDQVGVITFESTFEELVPLAPHVDPDATAATVRGIMSGGGTNAGPALVRAGERLREAKAKHKHIVFLSDGRSERAGDLPALCESLAADGIKVSTIAIGDDADTPTMNAMAGRGGGTHYYVTNPDTLPQVFVKAVRVVRTPLIREEPFTPVVLNSGSSLLAGISTVPGLGGLTLTQARTEPTVVNAIATPGGEPVFAHWQAGLGTVAAFTSDAHQWAADWTKDATFEQFWTQVVRGVSRTSVSAALVPGQQVFRTQVIRDGSVAPSVLAAASAGDGFLRVRATVDAGDALADQLAVDAVVHPPGGAPVTVRLNPSGPGEFEGATPASAPGTYVTLVRPRLGDRPLAPLIAGTTINHGVEFRFRSSNDRLLRQVAERGGGRVLSLDQPAAEARLFDRAGVPPRESLLPFWHLLAWIALGALLLDVANRRVAWDRWVAALRDGLIGRAPEPAAALAAERLASLRSASEERTEADAQDGLALGPQEAERLAMQARDRRRATALESLRSQARGSEAPVVDAPPRPATGDDSEGGLRAAKRRAAERFKDDEPSSPRV